MTEFDFFELQNDFLDGLRTARSYDERQAQESIKSLITSKAEICKSDAETAELRSITELSFRLSFQELLDLVKEQQKDVLDVGIERMLGLTVWCAQQGLVDPPLVFHLFEDLFESQTIDKCKDLFFLIESRASTLAHDMFVGTDKGSSRSRNRLLQVCTDLLKRLSKTNNAEFCGRILIFLAYVFPLSDRSGLNVKSELNLANMTTIEDPPEEDKDKEKDEKMEVEKGEIKEDGDGPPVDYNFYRTFWGLQPYFQNHVLAVQPDKWPAIVRSIDSVLTAFACHANLEDVNQRSSQNHYFTKYLTSTNLMKLQLRDSNFRRHILVQLLIFFNALTTPTTKSSSTTLKDKQKQVITEMTVRVKELLEGTPPNGPQFTKAIFDIISRENNWVLWKREGCKPFEKQTPPSATLAGKRKRTEGPAKVLMGHAELSRLWNLAADNHQFLTSLDRSLTPSIDEFLKPVQEPNSEEYAKLKDNKMYMWKALRLISKHKLHYFSELQNNTIDELQKLLEKEKKGQAENSDEILKKDDVEPTVDEVPEVPEVPEVKEDVEMKEGEIKEDNAEIALKEDKEAADKDFLT